MNRVYTELLRSKTVAVQASGRLTEESLGWLNEHVGAGFAVLEKPFDSYRQLHDEESDITLVGRANTDIAQSVAVGDADFGIMGSDKVYEQAHLLEEGLIRVQHTLGFSACYLVYVENTENPESNEIVTSYPRQAREFAELAGMNANILHMHGGIESIARRRKSHMVEIQVTGSAMKRNGFDPDNSRIISNHSAVLLGQGPALLG